MGRNIVGVRGGWRTPREHYPPNQLTKAHRSSQKLKRQAQGLHRSAQALCVYVMAVSLVYLWHSGNACSSDSSCLLLGLFSSCWIALSCLNMKAFAMSYCILFCSVWLSLGGLLFLMGNRGGVVLGRWGGGTS